MSLRRLLALTALSLLPVGAFAIPSTLRIPRSQQARPGAPPQRALFSHTSHSSLRCYQCHPSAFPQARASFTHAEMEQGRFCGSCHDGRRAEAVTAFRCQDCHVK